MRRRDIQRFRFVGFYRCLDFVNTAPATGTKRPEIIRDFDDLVWWLHQAGLVETAQARRAISRWRGTNEGKRTHSKAIRFRARFER